MSIKDKLVKAVSKLVPTKLLTLYDHRQEPSSVAPSLNVDVVHGIFDTAQSGDTRDLFSLYRDMILSDSHSQGEFSKRKLAVLGDQMSLHGYIKDDAADDAAAIDVKAAIESCTGWTFSLAHLMDGCLYPLSIVEKQYRPVAGGYELQRLIPVPYHLLDYTTGVLKIRDVDPSTRMPMATVHDPDPNRYIIHRGHLLSTPDNWGGPMRSIVWWWLLSTMDREWWARFLDRYGSPFLVGKYDQTDDASRGTLQSAFSYALKIGGLVISKETEVEIQQAAASDSGEAYSNFIDLCQNEKSKLIIGQVLSSDAQATGMGSGVAALHSAVRGDIRIFDAAMLAETLRDQLFTQIVEINGLSGTAPKCQFGQPTTDEEAKVSGEILAALAKAGLEVTDPGISILSDKVGIPLQRNSTTPSVPFSVSTYAADDPRGAREAAIHAAHSAGDAIAGEGSADLSQAFRGRYAPVARIIRESRSASECQDRIAAYFTDLPPGQIANLLSEALEAFTANAAASL